MGGGAGASAIAAWPPNHGRINLYCSNSNFQQRQFWNQAQGRHGRENVLPLPDNVISRSSRPDLGRIRGETARNNDVLLAQGRPAPSRPCHTLFKIGIASCTNIAR